VDGESRAGAASERQREPTRAAAAIARPVAGVDAKEDRDEARCVAPAVGGNRHAFLFCCGSDGNRRAAGADPLRHARRYGPGSVCRQLCTTVDDPDPQPVLEFKFRPPSQQMIFIKKNLYFSLQFKICLMRALISCDSIEIGTRILLLHGMKEIESKFLVVSIFLSNFKVIHG
jgi:hypothetical protein